MLKLDSKKHVLQCNVKAGRSNAKTKVSEFQKRASNNAHPEITSLDIWTNTQVNNNKHPNILKPKNTHKNTQITTTKILLNICSMINFNKNSYLIKI